jgi:xylono-1,5-lactonase
MALNIPNRRVLDAQFKLGEGALWDAARQVVWFVDIKRHYLWHYDPATGSNARAQAPDQIGWALPADNGLLLCGLKDGLYTFDPATQAFAKLMDVPGEPAHNRLNDACTDPWGRVWFGSMDDSEGSDSGRFYMFDRGNVVPAGPSGISITNGPAISEQGDRIYFTDTLAQKIMVADLSPAGVGEARLFVNTGAIWANAYPDGPVVDAEGHVWSGMYAGSRVGRFNPDGQLVAEVEFTAQNITKMTFGGADFRTGYVTTASKDQAGNPDPAWPDGGWLLAFDAPVAGFAQTPVKM